MLSFYMNDYMQLGFYCEDHIMKHKDGSESQIGGYNYQSSDGSNYIMLNLYYIGKRMKDSNDFSFAQIQVFLDWFLECWWHEYLHMTGFNEEQVHFMTTTDVHTIDIDVEDDE